MVLIAKLEIELNKESKRQMKQGLKMYLLLVIHVLY